MAQGPAETKRKDISMSSQFSQSKKIRVLLSAVCVLASVSLSIPQVFAADSEDMKIEHVIQKVGTNGEVQVDWSEGVVRVTGRGTPPDHGPGQQKRLMAERSAWEEVTFEAAAGPAPVVYGSPALAV
jgi:hypothetical protein